MQIHIPDMTTLHGCPNRLHITPLNTRRSLHMFRSPFRHGGALPSPNTHMASRHCQRMRTQAAQTSAMPTELKKIVGAFQMVPDEMSRYKQLLFLASKLPPLPAEYQTEENKVKGCVSQVWVVGDLEDGKLKWQADSDSQLTKGLAALLVQGLSGCAPQEVLDVDPAGIIDALGLKQKLTPSRNNGFLNMFRLMQQKSSELMGMGNDAVELLADGAAAAAGAPPASDGASSSAASRADSPHPVYDSMYSKLQQALQPSSLTIIDESGQHAGHVGSRMKPGYSGETHFRVEVVSTAFEGMNTVKRHRTIYQLLQDELAGSVHALSLVTKAPEEA